MDRSLGSKIAKGSFGSGLAPQAMIYECRKPTHHFRRRIAHVGREPAPDATARLRVANCPSGPERTPWDLQLTTADLGVSPRLPEDRKISSASGGKPPSPQLLRSRRPEPRGECASARVCHSMAGVYVECQQSAPFLALLT